jgi:hypothetical protein
MRGSGASADQLQVVLAAWGFEKVGSYWLAPPLKGLQRKHPSICPNWVDWDIEGAVNMPVVPWRKPEGIQRLRVTPVKPADRLHR